MKKTSIIILLILLFCCSALSGEKGKREKLSYFELKEKFSEYPAAGLFDLKFDLSGRKITGLIYSAIVPGTGQFYLGHQYKGAAFTLLSSASLVFALVSQNDVVAMNEKIESLEYDYAKANTYTKANEVWVKMVAARNDAEDFKKSRNLFYGVYAGLWTLNILDLLFLTPDKGSVDFSYNTDGVYNLGLSTVMDCPALSLQINF
jgi:hypothetical protein